MRSDSQRAEVSEDDWNMLDYFWNDKGDLTRWCDWERFKSEHPRHPVVATWERYQAEKEALTLMVRGGRYG